jgi:hypothetical protein
MAKPLQQVYEVRQKTKETLSLAYQCYQAFLYNFPNRYKLLDKLKRHGVAEESELSDKTIYLSEKAKKILRVILKMIFRSNKAVVNQKYLNTITKCCDRHNRRLLNELLDFIQYEKIKVWKGRKFSYYFCIKLSASLQEEIRDTEPKNTNSTRTKMSDLICNNRDSNKLESRSNARAHESKFLNNSNSISLNEYVEKIESKDLATDPVDPIPLVSKRKFISNKRKKTTKAQRAARVYKMSSQYDKPKSLGEHYPLSQEDCWELQKRSGKGYNLNAMNEILLDMSRKPQLQGHSFVSKAKFMAYMTKAYREEGRDVDKANSPTFKIIKRRPKAEVTEIITLAERERYLNKTENAGIYSRCDFTQLRAKIAGQFPVNLGYDLLKNMIGVKKNDYVFEITMHTEIDLTEHYKQLLLNNVNAVGGYAGVKELEFVIKA